MQKLNLYYIELGQICQIIRNEIQVLEKNIHK